MGSNGNGSRVRPRRGGVTRRLVFVALVRPDGVAKGNSSDGSRVGPTRDGVTRRLVDVALVRPDGVTKGHVWSEYVTMGHDGGGEGSLYYYD